MYSVVFVSLLSNISPNNIEINALPLQYNRISKFEQNSIAFWQITSTVYTSTLYTITVYHQPKFDPLKHANIRTHKPNQQKKKYANGMQRLLD